MLRAASAAVGVGLAGFPSGHGRTHLELIADATAAAARDAGIQVGDIDGIFTTNLVNFMPAVSVSEYLGLNPRWIDASNIGGASFVHYAMSATLALSAGLCDVALLVYGSDAGSNKTPPLSLHEPLLHEAEFGAQFPIAGVALAASAHMHAYGTTRAQMAAVALSARRWAALNPEIPPLPPLSIEQLLAAPYVARPFSIHDCGQMTDGAAAVIMVASDRAERYRRPPVYFLGGATAISHRRIAQATSLTTTLAAQTAPAAFAMAGLAPSDIDVLQLYDGFTIYPILFLEDLGFCDKGKGGPLVESGAIAPGGRLPVNTNGGSLCSAHPGMYGLFLIAETIRQLRGDGGAAQVDGARFGLTHGNGGHLSTQSTAIWGRQPSR
ncbi:acetyl-CoA acetyltransferase [Rhodopseudomonas rhenobacensis]|uniref:Acetyl-CoA acetyltransferase n=1 Tax=Rhodopseudomonas rhenobacensis TaxID=87461 RepID=A0A7W7Z8W7_9BRAD|nr:acetyl-CoA acetyltransferase [Rhodopseudomonas rhenobacensis]MBB5049965.1 acetyl-CoA acetyltransferase [Rhodopseudomonas rhenobacensis]